MFFKDEAKTQGKAEFTGVNEHLRPFLTTYLGKKILIQKAHSTSERGTPITLAMCLCTACSAGSLAPIRTSKSAGADFRLS